MSQFPKIHPKINPALDQEQIARDLARDKMVVISDFLDKETAEELHKFLDQTIDPTWWYWAISGEKKNYWRDLPEHQEKIRHDKEGVPQIYRERRFSYRFRRSINNHGQTCPCQECQFKRFLRSQPLLNWLSVVSQLALKEAGELFASCYSQNDFLSIHTDENNGELAFVYNLTKNWSPMYGGLFHLLAEDWVTCKRVLTPGFNKLVLFLVPDKGQPHFVSPVYPGITQKRLAFGGWYRGYPTPPVPPAPSATPTSPAPPAPTWFGE